MLYWICTLFLGTFGWGISLFLIKILLTTLTPIEIVLYRMVIGCVILFFICGLFNFKLLEKKYLIRDGFILAIFNIVIPFYLTTYAEKSVTSSLASVVNGLTPVFTFLLGIIFIPSQQYMNVINFISILLGFVGIWVMNLADPLTLTNLASFLALIIASLSYAIAANYVKIAARIKNPILLSAAAAFFSTVIMLISKLVTAERYSWHLPQDWQQYLALLWLGCIGSGISLYLYCLVIQRNGAVKASMVTYLMLVTGVLAGGFFLKEVMSWMVALGCACVILSVLLINHADRIIEKIMRLHAYFSVRRT